MPKMLINKQTIYYEIHGEPTKLPLLLIPGLGQYHIIWTAVLDKLLKANQVILLDNRGSGQSSVPVCEYTTYDMAQDINHLLEALNIPSVNIIGYSMGGLIAQEFALNFPQKLNKLILYSTFVKLRIRAQKLLLNTARFFELGYIEDALNSILINTYSDNFLANQHLVNIALQGMRDDPYPQTPEAFKGQFDACCKHNTEDRAGKINKPTLIIGGMRDILSMQDDISHLQSIIPGAIAKVIPEVAHTAHIENTNSFVQIVDEFLAGY